MNMETVARYVVELHVFPGEENCWEILLLDRYGQTIWPPEAIEALPADLLSESGAVAGRHLFDRLFAGGLAPAWRAIGQRRIRAGLPLRLDLVLPGGEASALDDWPFEWLDDGSGALFRDGQNLLVRTFAACSPKPVHLEPGMRWGVIWANPGKSLADRLSQGVIDDHVGMIRQSASALELVAVEPCATATLAGMQNYCRKKGPLPLLTLVAHGKGSGGSLLLHQEGKGFPNDSGEPLDGEKWLQALKSAQTSVALLWTGTAGVLRAPDPALTRAMLSAQGADLAMVIGVQGSLPAEQAPRVMAHYFHEVQRAGGALLPALAAVHGTAELEGVALVCHARPEPGLASPFESRAADFCAAETAAAVGPEVSPEWTWLASDPEARFGFAWLAGFSGGLPTDLVLALLGESAIGVLSRLLRAGLVAVGAEGHRLSVPAALQEVAGGLVWSAPDAERLSGLVQATLGACVERFRQARRVADPSCGLAVIRAESALVRGLPRMLQFWRDLGRLTPEMARSLFWLVQEWRAVSDASGLFPVAQESLSVVQGVDEWTEVSFYGLLGEWHDQQDHLEEAERCYRKILDYYQRFDNRLGEAEILLSLGNLLVRTKRAEEAEGIYRAALQRARQLGLQSELAILRALGLFYGQRARWDEAEQVDLEALQCARQGEERLCEAELLVGLGRIAQERWRYPEAKERYLAALPLMQQCEEVRGEAGVLRALGVLSLRMGHPRDAETYGALARSRFQQLRDRAGEADVLELLSQIHQFDHKEVEALAAWRESRSLRRQERARQMPRLCALEVRDFKGIVAFERAWSADERVWMVGGGNGAGKSALLEAVWWLLQGVAYGLESVGFEDWIRVGCQQALIRGEFQVGTRRYRVALILGRGGAWRLEGDVEALAGVLGEDAAVPGLFSSHRTPFAFYFPASRKLAGGPVSLGAVIAGSAGSGFYPLALRALLGSTGQFAGLDRLESLESLQQLNAILLKYAGCTVAPVRVGADQALELRLQRSGVVGDFSWEGLSSAQQERVAMWFQLWHATVRTPAIVLIDGPELHLDEAWRERWLQELVEWLPDNQYLLATRSGSFLRQAVSGCRVILGG